MLEITFFRRIFPKIPNDHETVKANCTLRMRHNKSLLIYTIASFWFHIKAKAIALTIPMPCSVDASAEDNRPQKGASARANPSTDGRCQPGANIAPVIPLHPTQMSATDCASVLWAKSASAWKMKTKSISSVRGPSIVITLIVPEMQHVISCVLCVRGWGYCLELSAAMTLQLGIFWERMGNNTFDTPTFCN